jgi:hypothetical protein
MLIIHVPDNASEYDHQQAREALAVALSVQPGSVVQSSPTSPTPERVVSVQPAKSGIPAKGSPEAKARMARARAGKAQKSSTPSTPSATTSTPKASDRLAELAAKAGIAATPAQAEPKARKASAERYSLPTYAGELPDDDYNALVAFAGRLVDDRKLKAFVLWLEGKTEASTLEGIASRTGTLRSHAERTVVRARRGEDS